MYRPFIRFVRSVFPNRGAADYLNDQGVGLAEQGHYAEAKDVFEKALDANPKRGEAWCNLAACLDNLGRPLEACDAYASAESNNFKSAFLYDNWGNALSHCGRLTEASNKYQTACELDGALLEAKANLGLTLLSMGRIEEGASQTAEAWARAPSNSALASMSLFAAQYSSKVNPQQLLADHRRWPQAPNAVRTQHPHARDPDRRLRVGYVSGDFRYHSCACFLLPVFEAHDRNTIEIYAYNTSATSDVVTGAFQQHTDCWVDCHAVGENDLAQRISRDEIDLLVDCSGHTKGNRLKTFDQKPAPIQLTWLGYPSTTGLNTIDYKICDAIAAPPDEEESPFTETVLRLENGFHTYRPLVQTAEPNPPPVIAQGSIHFGAFHNLSKISERTVGLWAAVMRAVPDSRLILKARGLNDEQVKNDVSSRLAAAGIAQDRVVFLAWSDVYGPHFEDFKHVDIALDTIPYSGTTTTCEALWMGVPVVTLFDQNPAGRVGASLLSQMGRSQWVAHTEDEYVQIAAALSSDVGQLEVFRGTLRSDMCESPLGNAGLFTRSLEFAYRDVWQRWCGAPSD